jgi:hypothetical protein
MLLFPVSVWRIVSLNTLLLHRQDIEKYGRYLNRKQWAQGESKRVVKRDQSHASEFVRQIRVDKIREEIVGNSEYKCDDDKGHEAMENRKRNSSNEEKCKQQARSHTAESGK